MKDNQSISIPNSPSRKSSKNNTSTIVKTILFDTYRILIDTNRNMYFSIRMYYNLEYYIVLFMNFRPLIDVIYKMYLCEIWQLLFPIYRHSVVFSTYFWGGRESNHFWDILSIICLMTCLSWRDFIVLKYIE